MSTVEIDCFVGYFDAMASVGRKDYFFDWADFMRSGDTIQTFQVTADAGVVVGDGVTGGPAPSENGNLITCWLSFEAFAALPEYRVYCQIETAVGRIERKYAILRKCT